MEKARVAQQREEMKEREQADRRVIQEVERKNTFEMFEHTRTLELRPHMKRMIKLIRNDVYQIVKKK